MTETYTVSDTVSDISINVHVQTCVILQNSGLIIKYCPAGQSRQGERELSQ